MCVEGLAVAGREGGHPVSLGLPQMLKNATKACDHRQNSHEEPSAIDPGRVVERYDERVGGVPERGKQLDAPGTNRTCDLSLRRRALYPLSYGRLRTF